MASSSSLIPQPKLLYCLIWGCYRCFDNENEYQAHIPACRTMRRSPWQTPPRMNHIDQELPRPLTTLGYIRNTQLNLLICRICQVTVPVELRTQHPRIHGLSPTCDVNMFIDQQHINVITQYDPVLEPYFEYREAALLPRIEGLAVRVGYQCRICHLCLRHPDSTASHVRSAHYTEYPVLWVNKVYVQTLFDDPPAYFPVASYRMPRLYRRHRPESFDEVWSPPQTFAERVLEHEHRQSSNRLIVPEPVPRRSSAPDMHGIPILGLPDLHLPDLIGNLNIKGQPSSK